MLDQIRPGWAHGKTNHVIFLELLELPEHWYVPLYTQIKYCNAFKLPSNFNLLLNTLLLLYKCIRTHRLNINVLGFFV